MGKDDTARFSPRFNLSDPSQRKAAFYIEAQGKRMAQYLTNAILHYEDCPNLGTSKINYEKLSKLIVSSLLQELSSNMEFSQKPSTSSEKDSFLLSGLDSFG